MKRNVWNFEIYSWPSIILIEWLFGCKFVYMNEWNKCCVCTLIEFPSLNFPINIQYSYSNSTNYSNTTNGYFPIRYSVKRSTKSFYDKRITWYIRLLMNVIIFVIIIEYLKLRFIEIVPGLISYLMPKNSFLIDLYQVSDGWRNIVWNFCTVKFLHIFIRIPHDEFF